MMNLQEHIRKVLKEETQLPLSVMRRINHLDDIFMKVRKEISWYVCNFRNSNILLSYLYEKTLEEFYYTWMSEVVSDEDWESMAPKIEEYLDNNYKESTEQSTNEYVFDEDYVIENPGIFKNNRTEFYYDTNNKYNDLVKDTVIDIKKYLNINNSIISYKKWKICIIFCISRHLYFYYQIMSIWSFIF